MYKKSVRYKKVDVEYKGKGQWIITIDNTVVKCEGKMETEKEYGRWEIDGDGDKIWYQYYDGLQIDQWIRNPPLNLSEPLNQAGIKITKDLLVELYPLINQHDFR